MSCNQVGYEKSKQDLEQNPSEISNDQIREVMFSIQSNAAEITNKKTYSTTSNKPYENSDQTDRINLATGMSTLGNILEILDRTENQLKKPRGEC